MAEPLIRLSDDGFDIVDATNGDVVTSLRWAEVARIETYKVDLLTTDCICLRFEFRTDQPPLQVSEEWTGFEELFAPLARHFPVIPESWYVDVMTPVFETKRTVLYDASVAARRF